MRRLLLVLFGAMFLTVAMAGTALAADGGSKGYIWPAHCNTELILLMHTDQTAGVTDIRGRMDFATCGNPTTRAYEVSLVSLTLWAHDDQCCTKMREITNKSNATLYNFSGTLWGTGSIQCEGKWTYWVNAKYYIRWQSGQTALRDNNSNTWSNVC